MKRMLQLTIGWLVIASAFGACAGPGNSLPPAREGRDEPAHESGQAVLDTAAAGQRAASGTACGAALPERVTQAIDGFAAELPPEYFARTHGFVVFPGVRRFGFGIGGAWGRGWVIDDGCPAGTVRFWQLTSGIQTGVRLVDLIVFFRDAEARQAFTSEGMTFMGQAGAALATMGAARSPGYSPDVALFARHRFGLMIEASIGFGSFAWRERGTPAR